MSFLYIAGPYSAPTPAGIEANVAAAIDDYNAALDMGIDAYLPHLSHYPHARKPRSWEEWMEIDLRWLRKSSAVYRRPGHSKGGDVEVVEATACGIPVFFSLRTAADFLLPARPTIAVQPQPGPALNGRPPEEGFMKSAQSLPVSGA